MRFLVAGGAGFIGSNLCSRLLAEGNEVICVDNLVTGRLRNIESFMTTPGFTFIQHDIIQPLKIAQSLEGVFNLASPASPPGYQRYALETMRVNSEGTRNLLDISLAHQAPMVYASTSEVYGDPLVHPQSEDYLGNVSSIGPRSMYDESKRFGEALCALFWRTRDADVRIVRIFNTYGPNSDPADGRLVPNFITQALRQEPLTIYGDGSQTRSLCYVTDLVEGLKRMLQCADARGQVVNLGNPEEHSVLEFATIIKRCCESASGFVFGPAAVGDDPQRRRPNITRAKQLLGWQPEISLEAGLKETIAYFRNEIGRAK